MLVVGGGSQKRLAGKVSLRQPTLQGVRFAKQRPESLFCIDWSQRVSRSEIESVVTSSVLPMIRSLRRFFESEYFFQPSQIFRRPARSGPFLLGGVVVPPGLLMTVNPLETAGPAPWHLGVYDLIAREIGWRLLQPRESEVDVGANVTVMSGVMARHVGSGGKRDCLRAPSKGVWILSVQCGFPAEIRFADRLRPDPSA